MTKSDMLTAIAVKTHNPLSINDRQVIITDGSHLKVKLHDQTCVTVDRSAGVLEIDGTTPTTRKSARMLNAILKSFGDCRVETHKGEWYLLTPDDKKMPFNGKIASVPIND